VVSDHVQNDCIRSQCRCEEQYLYVTDFCSSTIFGGYFFCKRCGRDYCLACENYFPTTLSDIRQSPWPLADAVRPRLLRCTGGASSAVHADKADVKPTPKGANLHVRDDLVSVSRFDEVELKGHWEALVQFVLEGRVSGLTGISGGRTSTGAGLLSADEKESGLEWQAKLRALGMDAGEREMDDELVKEVKAYFRQYTESEGKRVREVKEADVEQAEESDKEDSFDRNDRTKAGSELAEEGATAREAMGVDTRPEGVAGENGKGNGEDIAMKDRVSTNGKIDIDHPAAVPDPKTTGTDQDSNKIPSATVAAEHSDTDDSPRDDRAPCVPSFSGQNTGAQQEDIHSVTKCAGGHSVAALSKHAKPVDLVDQNESTEPDTWDSSLYTKQTQPTAIPIPDPADLEAHSREFMKLGYDALTNGVFDKLWAKGEPIVVDGVGKRFQKIWTPQTMIERFGAENVCEYLRVVLLALYYARPDEVYC
jgi:lysine-specific demethylase 3